MAKRQKFGSFWTVQKLDAVENYLRFFTTALKKRSFKLCYIDAFSGSGNITLKDGMVVDGSAIRALKYPFDSYYFFDKDVIHCEALAEKINMSYHEKAASIEIINDDCNKLLLSIDQRPWYDGAWRGVIFLDPFAMELSWSCLEKINKTKAFDVWYLFPFSAVNRNLPRSGEIQQVNKELLTKIFGASDWEQRIYQESLQQSLFEDPNMEKIPDGLKQYIQGRLKETFPTVAPNPAMLRNEKNSPLFLLCFAGSNPGEAARGLSLRAAKHILDHV